MQDFNVAPYNPTIPKHEKDFKYILNIEEEEGWEYLPADIASFIKSKQTNIYLIHIEEKCIGSISLFFDMEKKFMAVGAFILDVEYRNKGLGSKVLTHCLTTYGHNMELSGLLCEKEKVNFYSRLGFKETGLGIAGYSLKIEKPTIEMSNFKLSELSDSEKKKIVAYDTKVTKVFRENFLYCMLENASVALASLKDSEVQGYALAQPFHSKTENGFRVSLYADNFDICTELFGKIFNHLQSITQDTLNIHLTCPYSVKKSTQLELRGFKFEYGPCPFLTTAKNSTDLYGEKTWGILTHEFG